MSDNFRKERIERLLNELKYELTRGMMENEIEERLVFTFAVPRSRAGNNMCVLCRFETRPTPIGHAVPFELQPLLQVVK